MSSFWADPLLQMLPHGWNIARGRKSLCAILWNTERFTLSDATEVPVFPPDEYRYDKYRGWRRFLKAPLPKIEETGF